MVKDTSLRIVLSQIKDLLTIFFALSKASV
jgi:hypothetical protein